MMKTKIEPTALQVRKRGRVCTVAKITYFTDDPTRPVLAVVWRGQRGTSEAISLPTSALEFAKSAGARDFYLRDDRQGRMFTITLEDFERQGWIGVDGERYVKLSQLRPARWRQWQYAEKTVLLDSIEHEQETTNSRVCQLEFGV